MDWIVKVEAQLEDAVGRLKSAYQKLTQLKASIWEMVTRHPELEQDARDAFAGLRSVIATKSLAGAFALVAEVEKIVTDSRAAYASESEALSAILAGLKALAN